MEKKAEEWTGPVTGPEAIMYALKNIDLDELEKEHREHISAGKKTQRPKSVHALNAIEGLKRNDLKPEDLMIRNVPVLPAAFRPFSMIGDSFVPGDANELYKDLISYRDNYVRVRNVLGEEGADDAREALYDQVRALYGYADPVAPKTKQRGVSGFLKKVTGHNPKFSYPQRKLFSKPQDSVGRGTIVVDPELGLDEVGVPTEMAWTMYAPYIQRRLVRSGMNMRDALKNVQDRTPHAMKALEREVTERPVIYSRAPSWHKFNVLAGTPKLIDGDAISINPLVTTGLNADFDGDAMNLHVPSLSGSVQEAYDKLMPSKMLFSIRDRDKVMPALKHEQVLGLYTAATRPSKGTHTFATEAEALDAIRSGKIPLNDEVEITGQKSASHEKSAVIKKVDDEYWLYTKDGKRVLGKHKSKEDAYKQEYAIQISKKNRKA